MAFFPLIDHVSLDEEVDEDSELGSEVRHCCFSVNGSDVALQLCRC
jgi:hypothetical protein